MYNQSLSTWLRKFRLFLFLGLLFPFALHASFIESTIGAAVVNDATATYYNPAALTLLTNSQIIALGSLAYSQTNFTGQATQSTTGFTQYGSSSTQSNYYLPSLYLGVPTTNKITVGLAIISNFFNINLEDNSILRYAQPNNNIRDIDFVPAIGVKFNEFFSAGVGINLSYAHFLMQPILGFPSLNVPDTQSQNECDGNGLGGDFGFLLKPTRATLIGFNYRSAITYRLNGKSIFESNPEVTSNHYHFNFWTPARSVISINQFVTPTLGFIGTIQRIQWSIFKDITINGIAAKIGSQSIIVNATIPYHWLCNILSVNLFNHF
jgi:long-chain fatty acid transport protein